MRPGSQGINPKISYYENSSFGLVAEFRAVWRKLDTLRSIEVVMPRNLWRLVRLRCLSCRLCNPK